MYENYRISGEWDSRKDCLSCGYRGVWEITENGDEMIVKEKPGAICCFFVPNCFLKTHHMKKVEDNKLINRRALLVVRPFQSPPFQTLNCPI